MRNLDLFRPRMPTTFGSAQWATKGDLRRASMNEPAVGKDRGPLIGWVTPAEIGGLAPIDFYANGEGHLLTAAPTRTGKGRGQIITNLLDWPGSAVVIDVKGENWEKTAGWRKKAGHRVIRFAPFEAGSAKWNPIDDVFDGAGDQPNDPVRQENVAYLAKLLIAPNPDSREPYWDNASKSLLQGLIMHVATAPLCKDEPFNVRERTMAEVRRLMMLGPDLFTNLLVEMASSPENWVVDAAATQAQMAPAREQTASVRTILMEHTKIWSHTRVNRVTSRSDFSFAELRSQGKDHEPTTIYIVIPPDELTEYRSVLRVLVGSCMRYLRRNYVAARHDKEPPVLLILDEFPQLEYMQPIEEAMLYLSGYGVKFWFFVQDLGQLRRCYPTTWQSFIANCGVRCFFGVSDIETAKMVSEMSGQSTVRNRSYQVSENESEASSDAASSGSGSTTGASWSSNSFRSHTFTTTSTRGRGFSASLAYTGRPLFMPDEVMGMPFGSMIAFVKGFPVIKGQLTFWDRRWNDRGRLPAPN